MSGSKIILALAFLGGIFIVLALFAPYRSPYLRFIHHNQHYYARLAHACDALLAQHPLGTNRYVEISPTDPSLAHEISGLHPT